MSNEPIELRNRVSTGISGLDEVLGGGFPKNRIYLIQGDPGAGKTTIGLQYLLEGRRQGEKGVYVTLSETKAELVSVAQSHGWDLTDIEVVDLSTIEEQLSLDYQNTLFHPSEVELNETTKILLDEIGRIQPTRAVFDSLSEIRLLAQDSLRYRREILTLKRFFAGRQCTVFLLDDMSADHADIHVQSLAHGVMNLQQLAPDYGSSRRRLNVKKVRGLNFRGGYHDYVIRTGGLVVFPRLIAAQTHGTFKKGTASSGIPELDSLLGGGLDIGTSTLILGPAGCGKSTVAVQYASAAMARGEKVSFYIFEETLDVFYQRIRSLGFDFENKKFAGLMKASHIDPAELSPGEFACQIQEEVKKNNVHMIIIDSLNGYINAMPEERSLMLQLHELIATLNQSGVLTILIMAEHGFLGSTKTPGELSYLADTVLTMRYFEAFGVIRQAISVLKKRTGFHERTIRELHLDSTGLHVGRPLKEFQGILTGNPIYEGSLETLRDAD